MCVVCEESVCVWCVRRVCVVCEESVCMCACVHEHVGGRNVHVCMCL